MHLHCPTTKAVLLVGFLSDEGILRFPTEGKEVPGLFLDVKPLTPINEQFCERLREFVAEENVGLHLQIRQDILIRVDLPSGEESTMFLGRYSGASKHDIKEWSDLSSLIKSMPKDRSRLPYLKALQVLSGEVF